MFSLDFSYIGKLPKKCLGHNSPQKQKEKKVYENKVYIWGH